VVGVQGAYIRPDTRRNGRMFDPVAPGFVTNLAGALLLGFRTLGNMEQSCRLLRGNPVSLNPYVIYGLTHPATVVGSWLLVPKPAVGVCTSAPDPVCGRSLGCPSNLSGFLQVSLYFVHIHGHRYAVAYPCLETLLRYV